MNVIADFVDAPDGLGDGYRIEARIVVWQAADVLRVPASALFRRGEGWDVFVVEGGARAAGARSRSARAGPSRPRCETGSSAGERVVLHPSDRLADGVRARPAP